MLQPLTVARVASLNLAQRNRWDERFELVRKLMKNMLGASVYLLQETDIEMAAQLAKALGWSDSAGRPCWRTDENRNTVLWDPAKWWDLSTQAESLSTAAGDLGDRHHRSVLWVELEHKAHKRSLWFGSAHLSNGSTREAASAREMQARVLAATVPPEPFLLGIDRNSRALSWPTRVLEAAGMVDVTRGADRRRSYPAGDTRLDAVHIDTAFARGLQLTNITLVEPPKSNGLWATDHRAWRLTVQLPQSEL